MAFILYKLQSLLLLLILGLLPIINYAHCAEDNSQATIPDCSTQSWKDVHLKICQVKKTSSSCNAFMPGLPAESPATSFADYIAAIDAKMDENNTQINYLKNEIPNVIANTDGGDTQALIAYINNLSNSDGKLKNKLLATSPLSADALLALLNRAVPLSNGNLQIVLTANSPLPQEVVDAIEEMSLPAGTQNIIDDAQTNDPQYLTLDYIDNQIDDLTSDNQLLQNEKVRQKLRNEDEPAAKEVLEQSVLIPSKKALAEELIVKKHVPESRNVIDAILMETTDLEEDQKFAEMMNTMADLKENGKTIYELEQTEEDVIRLVANSEKIVAAKAQVVMELAKKEHYPHPILKADDDNKSLQLRVQDNSQQNNQGASEFIKLYPSPNDGNMMIEYYLPGEDNADLIFYTTEGKMVASYRLKPSNHKTFINASDMFSNGMYYYKLLIGNRIISTDKVIIIR